MQLVPREIHGHGIWNVWLWIAIGLVFGAVNLSNPSGPRFRLWFSELVLYGLRVFGLWANTKCDLRKRVRLPRRFAPAASVVLVWLLGVVFEVSLTVTGVGMGGLHAETLPPFILAQGDYIPIALVTYLVIRRTRASFREVFFMAGGKSLTEGLLFTGGLASVLLAPTFWLSPIGLPTTRWHTAASLPCRGYSLTRNCFGGSPHNRNDHRSPTSGCLVSSWRLRSESSGG